MTTAFSFFIDNKPEFITQANYFFIPSFEYCNLHKHDYVIAAFGPQESLAKIDDKPYIKKYVYDPVSYRPEFFNYHYANSITYISDNTQIFEEYDYVLKADIDVFFSPSMIDFIPEVFTTGQGYYSSDKIQKILIQESNLYGLIHRGYFNVGSTWYGKSSDIIQVAKLTKELMLYLLNKYFSISWGEWPNWYGGVCSMYASDLAINHIISDLNISDKIDYSSAGQRPIKDILMAHCLHTDAIFSKFVFRETNDCKYASIDIDNLDIDITNNYCLYIAESSRRKIIQ